MARSSPSKPHAEPSVYRSVSELADFFRRSFTPREHWRIGIESEAFGLDRADGRPLGLHELETLGQGLERSGWERDPHAPHQRITPEGGRFSLEPGGQLEVASRPCRDIETLMACQERDLAGLQRQLQAQGAVLAPLGFHPFARLEAMPRVPGSRYQIMRRYMPRVGRHGLDMMHRTCALQLNLDYADEWDLVRRARAALGLQPLLAALFAHSPLCEGRPSGYRSLRYRVWEGVDADRCGMPDFFFQEDMSLARYVEYCLDVPLYSLPEPGGHVDVSGASFRDLLAGRLVGFEGRMPGAGDWRAHLNSLMPDVRIKEVLEMRAVDANPLRLARAWVALQVALLYSEEGLTRVLREVESWSPRERAVLRRRVPQQGVGTPFRGARLAEHLAPLVELARELLARGALRPFASSEATAWLDPLEDLLALPGAPADELVRAWLRAGDSERLALVQEPDPRP